MLETVAASDIVRASLLTLWGNVAGFLPRLIAALVVFLVGLLIAVLLGKLASYIVRGLQIDKALESVGFRRIWERSGFRLNTPYFFYELVKWFFVIVFLMAAVDILGLSQVAEFLQSVVFYLPNVFVAAMVMLGGTLIAGFLAHVIRGSVRAAQLASANFLAEATRWVVMIFSLLVALSQLGVASEVIRIVIIGVVGAGSLALGLAFGLGGRSHADEFIGKMKRQMKD